MTFPQAELTDHALEQVQYRRIDMHWLAQTLHEPEETIPVSENRVILQKLFESGQKSFLLRVFVDTNTEPFSVVTVYKTSKIGKYRRIQ